MADLTKKNKYGEIILEPENTFRIICDLCSDTFLTLENFRYHIYKHIQNDESEDSTDSFLDFIFKDDTNLEKTTNLKIELNPIEREQIKSNSEKLNEPVENINSNITIENLFKTIDADSINETVEFSKNVEKNFNSDNFSDNCNEIEDNTNDINIDDKTTDTDNDSIKSFDNLEQKKEYDYNVIRDKLKNLFKLYKDYCPICLHTFTSVSGLIQHTKIHLREQTKEEIIEFYKNYQNNKISKKSRLNRTFDNSKKLYKLKCAYCDKTFIHNIDLQRHRRTHIEKITCKLCHIKFNSNFKYSSHMRDNHNIENPFECEHCSQKFKKYAFLSRHLRFHNNDKRYECEYCGKCFMENNQRKLHIRSHHTYEKLYQCDECGRTFTSLSEFKMHKLRHSNKREYNCTKCDKKFFTSYSLKNHFVIHTKEKPYECNVCNAKFGMRGSLWTHKRLHSNERKYKCKICAKSFVQSAGLHSHMKTHCSKEQL